MLKVEHVTFRYERRGAPVLRDASLSLETGQVGVLLGRNGCGKTTLLKTDATSQALANLLQGVLKHYIISILFCNFSITSRTIS